MNCIGFKLITDGVHEANPLNNPGQIFLFFLSSTTSTTGIANSNRMPQVCTRGRGMLTPLFEDIGINLHDQAPLPQRG